MKRLIHNILIAVSLFCLIPLPFGCSQEEASPLPEPTTTTTTTTTSSAVSSTSTATTTASASTTKSASTSTATTKLRDGGTQLTVPLIYQFPDYPSACESVSAVMVLRYWGEDITVDEFIDDHLQTSSAFYWKNGKQYGPSPYESYLGNPYTTRAYGCMAPVIEKALNSYLNGSHQVLNTTDTSLEALCNTYIDNGIPVLVWATIGMIDTYTSDEWLLEDGTVYEWPANEHCMVLIGYDKDYYYFNDPYRGEVKKYAKWLCEKRYEQLGKQSVVISK